MEPHNFEKIESEEESQETVVGPALATADQTLFNLLKDLRKKIAKKEGIAPYMVFEDPALQDMSIYYPITIKELLLPHPTPH